MGALYGWSLSASDDRQRPEFENGNGLPNLFEPYTLVSLFMTGTFDLL
jgi:hypothetical protein